MVEIEELKKDYAFTKEKLKKWRRKSNSQNQGGEVWTDQELNMDISQWISLCVLCV